jgi:hypothetical protein
MLAAKYPALKLFVEKIADGQPTTGLKHQCTRKVALSRLQRLLIVLCSAAKLKRKQPDRKLAPEFL